MRVTIVSEDNVVVVEGFAESVDCSSLVAQNVRAVQWYSEFGEVEFFTDLQTGHRDPNAKITDFTPFQPFLDAWVEEAKKENVVDPRMS